MRLLTAISIASLVVSIAALVLVLGLYAELDKSEPDTATSDAPLLDEETVIDITYGFVAESISGIPRWQICYGNKAEYQAEYVGADIWVVKYEDAANHCTFAVHDKEAHVILPK